MDEKNPWGKNAGEWEKASVTGYGKEGILLEVDKEVPWDVLQQLLFVMCKNSTGSRAMIFMLAGLAVSECQHESTPACSKLASGR